MSARMAGTGAKLARFALASLGFGLLLAGIYVVHVRAFRVDVVFYSALFDGLLALAIAGAGLAWLRAFAIFNGFEKLQIAFAWTLFAYVYAISVPTVIDRSLSFYFLEKLQQRGGSMRIENFEEVFTQEYAREHQLVAVRLTEQLQSGTVTIDAGCVRLTGRGERLAEFSRFFRQNLLPRQRLLMGRYTDALTDPFRGTQASREGSCGPAQANVK